jgi:hypothetical protein
MPPLRSTSRTDPAVKSQITRVKLFGIPCVIVLFLTAAVAAMGYFPRWVFWTATVSEILLGPYLISKINTLRHQGRSRQTTES